jgi:hypothetical protein
MNRHTPAVFMFDVSILSLFCLHHYLIVTRIFFSFHQNLRWFPLQETITSCRRKDECAHVYHLFLMVR